MSARNRHPAAPDSTGGMVGMLQGNPGDRQARFRLQPLTHSPRATEGPNREEPEMLLYDVTYYSSAGKIRQSCDSNIPQSAISMPTRNDIMRVQCTNGYPAVEWWQKGKRIDRPVWAKPANVECRS